MSKIEQLVMNTDIWGKFNCILFFEAAPSELHTIYKTIIQTFKPIEVSHSSFNLDQSGFTFDSITMFPVKDDNRIIQIILSKGIEQISLYYVNGKFIIEHLFHVKNLKQVTGTMLIKYFILSRNYVVNVLGFELSLNIESFFESLMDLEKDKSLQPVIVRIKDNNQVKETLHLEGNNQVIDSKMNFIKNYINFLQEG